MRMELVNAAIKGRVHLSISKNTPAAMARTAKKSSRQAKSNFKNGAVNTPNNVETKFKIARQESLPECQL